MSGRIKHSANEGSTGPKPERILKNPDQLDGLWVYTDGDGKPYFAAGRGEGRDTAKAYEIYTIGPPDSLEDQEVARTDHQPFRSGWVQVGGLSDSIRAAHGIAEGKSLPYRFPDLLALPPDVEVFVTEGERDAENLWLIGLAATCVEGTMTTASRHDWQEALSGHPVTVVNDADLRGLQRVQQIVKSVKALSADNKPKSLRVLPLERAWYDCPANGDITDFLSAKASELDDMRGMTAPPWPTAGPRSAVALFRAVGNSAWQMTIVAQMSALVVVASRAWGQWAWGPPEATQTTSDC